jgi:hypothetical protein
MATPREPRAGAAATIPLGVNPPFVIYSPPNVGFDPGNTNKPMSTSFWDHPVETIEKALHLRKQIEALQAELSEIYSGAVQPVATKKADGRRGKRSPAARAKMAAAQKARWAKKRGAAPASPVPKAPKKKRTFSAATRKKMAAAAKARWAKKKIAPLLNPPNNLVW